MKREEYYQELIEYILEEFYEIELDRSKNYESLIPKVRIDLYFEIPKYKLSKSNKKSPFPHFREQNLIQIKAFQDKLSNNHFKQYIGQLYIKANAESSKKKSTVLVIVSAEEPTKTIFENSTHTLQKTENAFIDRIKADEEAYLFVLERLPIEEKYWYFLPFLPLKVLKREKDKVVEIAKKVKKKKEYENFLLWLNKLQNKFYKEEIQQEVDMALGDKKAIAVEFFPKASKEIAKDSKEEQLRADIIRLLDIRFQRVSKKVKDKISSTQGEKELYSLFEKAAKAETIKEFQSFLE